MIYNREYHDKDISEYLDMYKGLIYYETFKIDKKYIYLVHSIARQEGINPELLFGIILIEKINRGHWLTRFSEKVFIKLFPKYLIKRDASLGISQIKVSTAKLVTPSLSDIEILDALSDDFKCISICSKLINYYLEIIKKTTEDNDKIILILTSLYLTGEIVVIDNDCLFFYNNLLEWCISEKLLNHYLELYN